MKLFFLLIFAYVILGCTFLNKGNNTNVQHQTISQDTIFVKVNSEVELCQNYSQSYFQKFGVVISKYYSVQDSVIFIRDNVKDYFVVLTPVNLDTETECYGDTITRRVLVHIQNKNGKSEVIKIYDNLISNVGGLMNNYIGISNEEDNLKIIHESGMKYNYSYEVMFVFNGKHLMLKNIVKSCSVEDKSIVYKYQYDTKKTTQINVLDSLSLNCNCDIDWSRLEAN